MEAVTAWIGAISANEEPRYEGRRPAVIRKNSRVPIAVKKSVVDGGEFSQQRNKEGGTKHCDHVLGTNASGARPRESFIRKDDVAGINGRAVTVKLPTEQRGLRFAHKRKIRSVDGQDGRTGRNNRVARPPPSPQVSPRLNPFSGQSVVHAPPVME